MLWEAQTLLRRLLYTSDIGQYQGVMGRVSAPVQFLQAALTPDSRAVRPGFQNDFCTRKDPTAHTVSQPKESSLEHRQARHRRHGNTDRTEH